MDKIGDYEIHSIEWLEQYISDIKPFLKILTPFFNAGGMLAGGSLRRAIERGNFFTLFDIKRKWKKYNAFHGFSHPFVFDLDFFYKNKEDFVKSVFPFELKYGDSGSSKYCPRIKCYSEKNQLYFLVNLIDLHFGDEKTILDSFDFVNCKILINNEKVWIHKDLIYLENENILKLTHIDLTKNKTIRIIERVNKYLDNGIYKNFIGSEILIKFFRNELVYYYGNLIFYDNRVFDDGDILQIFCKNVKLLPDIYLKRKKFEKSYIYQLSRTNALYIDSNMENLDKLIL